MGFYLPHWRIWFYFIVTPPITVSSRLHGRFSPSRRPPKKLTVSSVVYCCHVNAYIITSATPIIGKISSLDSPTNDRNDGQRFSSAKFLSVSLKDPYHKNVTCQQLVTENLLRIHEPTFLQQRKFTLILNKSRPEFVCFHPIVQFTNKCPLGHCSAFFFLFFTVKLKLSEINSKYDAIRHLKPLSVWQFKLNFNHEPLTLEDRSHYSLVGIPAMEIVTQSSVFCFFSTLWTAVCFLATCWFSTALF